MKISFFGASITQQKNGYVHYFKELNPEFEVSQYGYGSMYITDAGICFIDDILLTRPEYCFLDWFSPACYRPPEKIKYYLDAIVGKLFEINCHPIFLFFYRKQMDSGWFQMFNYLKKYAKIYEINCIDLSGLEGADQYLRDSIHTNELGSKIYGERINERFQMMKFKKCDSFPKKNKWSKVFQIDADFIATKHIKLESLGCSSIVGVLQEIGPYTEDIRCLSQNKEYMVTLKDKWSEKYERTTMKINIDFCDEITMKISENNKIVWKKIFYTGDVVRVAEYV